MFPLLKIEEVIPNLKFIHLRRKNLIKQTISEFFARKTNVYFVKNKKELTEYQELKVDYDEDTMLDYYKKAIIRFNSWKPLLTKENHINIFYEELIDNPKEIFLKIFDFIGIIATTKLNIEATLITSHPLKEEYEKRFTDFLIKKNYILFEK
jgi:LPS sulfotransferase NodH